MYPGLPPRRVLSALALLGAVAVAVTGSLLLWSYRRATLDAAADREAVLVAARANALGDELNTATVTVLADATGPLPVANLAGRPTY